MFAYRRLSTDFYDAEKPAADESEVDLFARFLKEGPSLEAMCGSGRLLIPLLHRGFRPEGVDNAPAMLDKLARRCHALNLPPPPTFLQSITELVLPHRYSTIFIALGSFQLISEEAAVGALNRLRLHLAPHGTLVIDTFVPWDLIESSESTRQTTRTQRVDGRLIRLNSRWEIDRPKQTYRVFNRYVDMAEEEEEVLTVQWYFPEQFTEISQAAGFSSVSCHALPLLAPLPRRYLYTMQAGDPQRSRDS
jgi:hypothetical protein